MPQEVPSDSEKKLTGKQRQAALLLANGSTIENTASKVSINEKTIDRWKHDPVFLAAVHQAENDIYNEALGLLKKTTKAAILCLVRNMDGKVSAYVQVQAASKLLEQSMEVHKMQELELRLQELEERLKGR